MSRRVYVILISLIFVFVICGLILSLSVALTPYRLREAIRTNDFKTFSRLITPRRANEPHQLSIDITIYLIHYACSDSRVDIVRLLLDQGADIHARDSGGQTCVFHAVGSDDIDEAIAILKILHSKDSTILEDREPANGDTVLHYAVRIGTDARIIAELLRLGAKRDALNAKDATPADVDRERGENVEVKKLLQRCRCGNGKRGHSTLSDTVGRLALVAPRTRTYGTRIMTYFFGLPRGRTRESSPSA